MERYLTSTELKQNLKRVKEYAQLGVVHILENGHEGYVFCSEEVYEEKLQSVRERAMWQTEVRETCREAICDTTVLISDVVPCENGIEALKITQLAARKIATEYNGGTPAELEYMLKRIQEEPEFGLSIELDGLPCPARKVLVPPHDILYTFDETTGDVIILGLVKSLSRRA